jgi:hypothetical protein
MKIRVWQWPWVTDNPWLEGIMFNLEPRRAVQHTHKLSAHETKTGPATRWVHAWLAYAQAEHIRQDAQACQQAYKHDDVPKHQQKLRRVREALDQPSRLHASCENEKPPRTSWVPHDAQQRLGHTSSFSISSSMSVQGLCYSRFHGWAHAHVHTHIKS